MHCGESVKRPVCGSSLCPGGGDVTGDAPIWALGSPSTWFGSRESLSCKNLFGWFFYFWPHFQTIPSHWGVEENKNLHFSFQKRKKRVCQGESVVYFYPETGFYPLQWTFGGMGIRESPLSIVHTKDRPYAFVWHSTHLQALLSKKGKVTPSKEQLSEERISKHFVPPSPRQCKSTFFYCFEDSKSFRRLSSNWVNQAWFGMNYGVDNPESNSRFALIGLLPN